MPHSSSLLWVATRGVGAVTPFGALPTETPGKVLPMMQVDHPPIISVHNVCFVRGLLSSTGSPYPGLGHSVRSDVMDQLRVTSVTCEPSLPPLSALSPSSFLYPSSDSGFVSLYSSATSLSSVAFLSSASSSVYTSSFTPLSSSTSASSFSLPLSYPPWPSVLSSSSFCAAPSLSSFFLFLSLPPRALLPLFFPLPRFALLLLSRLFFLFLSLPPQALLPLFLRWSLLCLPLLFLLFPLPLLSTLLLLLTLPLPWITLPLMLMYWVFPMNICLLRVVIIRLMVRISSLFSLLTVLILRLMLLRISLLAPLFFSLPSGPPPLFLLTVRLLLWHLFLLPPLPFFLPPLPLLCLLLLLLLLLLFSLWVSLLLRMLRSPPLLSCLPSPWVRLCWLLLLFLLRLSLFPPLLLHPSLSTAGVPPGYGAVVGPGPSALPLFAPPSSSASLFRHFDASAGPSGVLSSSSVPAPPPGVPHHPLPPLAASFSSFAPGPSFAPPQHGPEVPEPPLAPPVPDSVRAEIRRMYVYIVDLFPQAAGSPAAPPPPWVLFEDFFVASPASTHLPVFLDWFARMRSSLSDADTRLASLLSTGRPASSILPQRLSQYAVHGDFSSSAAVPVNPSLLSMFERSLRPSLQLGITLREAGLMESSSRFHSEALSHSMWLLSALLAFVRLQGFAPADASLFNTLVTSLSRCLAHQASISASFTAFLGLKRRDFCLSHLPAYFSEANKRAILAAPVVGATSLFAESDVAHLLADTQTSSSLRSQQALVNVASRGSGEHRRRSSPYRSPARTSPARRRRRSSGSPARSEKRVRFDSPAPSSALRDGKQGFRR